MHDGAAGPCYACGGPTQGRTIGPATIEVCTACGFGRLVGAQHAEDYWRRTDDLDRELEERYWQARLAVQRRALAAVARRHGTGRVVDLGGGVGYFARCALDMGWDAYSVDVSEAAAATAAARVGPGRSLLSPPLDMAGTCDVVTLWCVLAHVPDPRSVVADAAWLLRPGGRLLVTTPNFSFQARYAAIRAGLGRPLDFAASDHVLHFTPASLCTVLGDCGLAASSFAYWGVTEDCLLDRDRAAYLVPLKRAWNATAWRLSRLGLPLLVSELQAQATRLRADC